MKRAWGTSEESKHLRRMEQIGKKIRAVGEKLERDGGYDLMYRVCTSLEWKRWQNIVSRYWDGVVERWRY